MIKFSKNNKLFKIVPENFDILLKDYTKNGYRVIALAGKLLDSSVSWLNALKIPRDSIESELEFYGFLIMQNKIKPETEPVITELHNAALRTVMVTGDNLLTAVNVAWSCGMVNKQNRIVLVEADESRPEGPSIEWKLADPYTNFDEEFSYQRSATIVFDFINFC